MVRCFGQQQTEYAKGYRACLVCPPVHLYGCFSVPIAIPTQIKTNWLSWPRTRPQDRTSRPEAPGHSFFFSFFSFFTLFFFFYENEGFKNQFISYHSTRLDAMNLCFRVTTFQFSQLLLNNQIISIIPGSRLWVCCLKGETYFKQVKINFKLLSWRFDSALCILMGSHHEFSAWELKCFFQIKIKADKNDSIQFVLKYNSAEIWFVHTQ